MTPVLKNFTVSDLFTPQRGKSKYTRAYAEAHPGAYPVYSASLAAPLCFIDSWDYEGTFLTWTTNGYGGRVQPISGKFSINADRGILLPEMALTAIDLGYIRQVLEPILIAQAVGRVVDGKKNEYTKISPDTVGRSEFALPVNVQSEIDFQQLRMVSEKLRHMRVLQASLQKQHESIELTELCIEIEEPFTTFGLGESAYFSLSIGERVLKKESQTSGIPVYSANVRNPFGYMASSPLNSFDEPSIIWGIDGVFDWNYIPVQTPFVPTDHCGRLLIKSPLLDPEYIFHYLRSTRLEYGFDRVFRANLDNMKDVVKVKVPMDSQGEICLVRQKEIARKYRNLDAMRQGVLQTLKSITSVKIELIG